MADKKWGESFLKTGLPLEHLTLTTFASLGWNCQPKWEYRRFNREKELTWFEVDLIAYSPNSNLGSLQLLTECKYHDEQRFWFFLPCSTVDHQAQCDALSAGGDLESDGEVLHYGPYSPLAKAEQHTLIKLAPASVWGVTVSRAGVREENSIQQALEQIGYAYVPFCLEQVYHFCAYSPEAVIPAIVTTAKLFRLKSDVNDLEVIRRANSPSDIADELSWTWCYYAPRGSVLDHNSDEIDRWREQHRGLKFSGLDEQLASLWSGPHWVLVATIESLPQAVRILLETFLSLPKDFSRNKQLADAVNVYAEKRRRELRPRGAV